MMAQLFNRLWLLCAQFEHRRFKAGLEHPEKAQTQILNRILHKNRGCQFGKQYRFANLNPESFRRQVPVQSAAEYETWLDAACEGATVLTDAPVLYFEKTSGTTGKARLVPYTAALRREIDRAVSTWMVSLSQTVPQAFAGPSYWSISPPLKGRITHTNSGLRIGAADAEYLSPLTRFLLSQILAVPASVSNIEDADEFFFQTLRRMLLTENLAMISVWSPVFIQVLHEQLTSKWQDLLFSMTPQQRSRFGSSPGTWKEMWPRLALVSCWTDAWAARMISSAKTIIGDVPVQGKGLLATEGVTSIPFEGENILAYRSHFYEFKDDAGNVLLAHELKEGLEIEVILTTGGGIYRMATGDLVRVTGFRGNTPCMQFLGRKQTSDMAGEKVTDALAAESLAAALALADDPELLGVFEPNIADRRYSLLLHSQSPLSTRALEIMAERAELILCRNPYYRQARACGELQAVNTNILSRNEWTALTTAGPLRAAQKQPSVLPASNEARYAAIHV